jgi:hypothetical protein
MPLSAGDALVVMKSSAVNRSNNIRTILYNAVDFYEILWLGTKKKAVTFRDEGTAGFDWLA